MILFYRCSVVSYIAIKLYAQYWHSIGTVLLFRRKSGYAILKMLKSI